MNKVTPTKFERLIKEICHKGNLLEFQSVIKILLSNIIDSGCNISCCETCETSKIEQSIDGTRQNHIRISFKQKKEKSIHLIWDILHEYGHHLSGKPNRKESSYLRELLAWDLGYQILTKFPELKKQEKNFNDYRDRCLTTYRKH